jgi:L,D-transpeptidase ErfK/SrfK
MAAQVRWALAVLLGAAALAARGAAPAAAPLPGLIGAPESALIEPEDTLLDVAWRHRLGFDRVQRLNPDVRVWIPDPGTVVHLPTQHVLPDVPHRGLVINIPEMQLYDFRVPGGPEVMAIAIGDEMDPSLLGNFRVGAKHERPVWRVPASIRAEKPELPALVPPGPENPLGEWWMTIGRTSYGIHGTNNRWSIGRMATHGCIRLYDDEMGRLYRRTPVGTPILLVYQSVKLGREGDGLYVESHPDIYRREPDREQIVLDRLEALGLLPYIDPRALITAIAQERGVPIRIGTLPPGVAAEATSRSAS